MPNWLPELGWWVAIPIIFVYWLGVWMGHTKRIVVYRNFTDVMMVGLFVIIPLTVIGIFLLVLHGEQSAGEGYEFSSMLLWAVIALLATVFAIVVVRTCIDNPNPLKALLALYVKIPTGVLFFFHFSSIFSSAPKKKRRKSLFWTLVMMPLVYQLVHDKSSMPRIFGRYYKTAKT